MSAEEVMLFAARVSNPANQNSGKTGLLSYCIRKAEWSIFEVAFMTVEINTTRVISHQLTRHRSFTFQEFSQRYQDVKALGDVYEEIFPHRQDTENRQGSIDDLSQENTEWFFNRMDVLENMTLENYNEALRRGISKEDARFMLMGNAVTRLYMTGSCRSWIHYLQLRASHATQHQHQYIANQIRTIFQVVFPHTFIACKENT